MTRRWKETMLLGAAGLAGIMALRAWRRKSAYSFRGKVVVITGGSRGLGLELARAFAAEGARVAVCARTAEDVEQAVAELQGSGAEVIGEACDVTAQQQVEGFIERV